MIFWVLFFAGGLVSSMLVCLFSSAGNSGTMKKMILSAIMPLLPYLWLLNLQISEHWRVDAGWTTEALYWLDIGRVALLCLSGIVVGEVLFWGTRRWILNMRAKKR